LISRVWAANSSLMACREAFGTSFMLAERLRLKNDAFVLTCTLASIVSISLNATVVVGTLNSGEKSGRDLGPNFARFVPLPLRQWAALAVVDEDLHLLMLLAWDALIGGLFGLNQETSGSRSPSHLRGKSPASRGAGLRLKASMLAS